MRIMCTLGCHQKRLGSGGEVFFLIIVTILFIHFKGDMIIALLTQI